MKIRTPLAAFEPAPDPIDEDEYPGDIEGDAEVELNQVQKGFIERMRAEQARALAAVSAGYYAVLVFEDTPQCNVFLKAMGLTRGGDLFIDGRALADRLGIELPAGTVRYNTGGPSKALAEFVRKPKLKGA